jgi:N4-gp56 family major capsid protein
MAYFSATATQVLSDQPHVPTVYYRKKALDSLKKEFLFAEPCEREALPLGSGKRIQWFRRSNNSVNTSNTTEGTVSTGTKGGSATLTADVGQYSDYIAVSDWANDLSFSDEVAAASDTLGYQAGLSVDTIVRTEIDSIGGTTVITCLGDFFSVTDGHKASTVLKGADVSPMDDGYFYGIMHAYTEYDMVNDPAAGGWLDLQKYTRPEKMDNTNARFIGAAYGVKWFRSNNVKIDTSATPDTYRSYVFGKGGVGIVDLEGKGPSKVVNPKNEKFAIKTKRGGDSIADPEGVIAGTAAYNFKFCAKVLKTSNETPYRFRVFDNKVSLVTT